MSRGTASGSKNEKVPVKVCGRLMTVRRQGKAGFCHIQQQGEKIQLYVRKDEVGDPAFELYKKLDAGDIIGAQGRLFRTRTGELTVPRGTSRVFLPKRCCRCPRNGTACRTSRSATVSATSTCS